MKGTLVPHGSSPSADLELEHSAALVALYLRGAPRGVELRVRSWPAALAALRRREVGLGEAASALEAEGLWEEAAVVSSLPLRNWARDAVQSGLVLSAASTRYPRRWLRALGADAPPCAWVSGEVPLGPWLSVLDSVPASRGFGAAEGRLEEALTSASESKWCVAVAGSVASGRAHRRMSMQNDPPILEILACGIEAAGTASCATRLSIFGPGELESAVSALARNRLVEALGDVRLVLGSGRSALGASRIATALRWAADRKMDSPLAAFGETAGVDDPASCGAPNERRLDGRRELAAFLREIRAA